MELKTNETNYTSSYETENAYPNPNDALFNQSSYDTPYQVTSTYSAAKAKSDKTNVIIIVSLLIIVAGIAGFMYMQKHKYDGKYELIGAESGIYSFTVEELEFYSGMSVEASLEVKGEMVYIDVNYTMLSENGAAIIDIDGDKVTITDGSETMYGTYDKGEKTITISDGEASLIFKKVD